MITKIKLDHFRAFKEAEIKISPLTIIAGQNSSGKSSILQALNSIFQSVQGRSFPFDLTLNSDKAHLGSFNNVVHGHNAKNSFGVGIEFSIDGIEHALYGKFKKSEEEGHLFPRQINVDSKAFGRMHIEWNQRKRSFNLTMEPSENLVEKQRDKLLIGLSRALLNSDQEKRDNVYSTLNISDPAQLSQAVELLYEAAASESRDGIDFGVNNFSELVSSASSNPFFDAMRRAASETVQQLDSRCTYIGPLRASPSRYFPLARNIYGVDASGEGASRTLAKWKDRKSSLIADVKRGLKQLELASDLEISVEHDEFLKIGIKPHGRLFVDSIADVGFGLSQILPMVVADVNLPKNGTLIINQPEIHLHPSSQALLANYFVDRLDNRQYIVETHSEYLINRLRLLVANGSLAPEMISVVYCSANEKGASSIHEVKIEIDGSITGAPSDFFRTYSADAFGIAMAVMENCEEDYAAE
ncbi:AAA family ATPase [Xanthomonas campestris]|uniref:AAA family ATPase n=1 Tax=Xanthomonas campestris TaxID=339 RepID=UPI000E1E688E|nr:AAA family ATPase [Xanthomonas campestris]WDJ06157.1 AAA family ATPase [Xanthomonas campestris pv. incanae]